MKLYLLFFCIIFYSNSYSQKIIRLKNENGVSKVECKINGLHLSFIFDTGASDVSLSLTEANFMLKNNYLEMSDILGKSNFQDATGAISEGIIINLRKIEFDGFVMYNVKASIVTNLKAPLLLGLSAIKKLGKIQLDLDNNLITILNPRKGYDYTSNKEIKQVQTKKLKPTNKIIYDEENYVKDNSVRVKIYTDSGTLVVKLYDSTPMHRDNFVKLVKQGFYDNLLFHRIIQNFMVQGGDPNSKNAPDGVMLGNGGDNMARIPAEFRKSLYHKKGALAAARDGNPEKASSACQFYIVQGKTLSDAELDMMEGRLGNKYSLEQRNTYKIVGGTPFLDQNYTVFGEVISGLEVVDKIASAPKAPGDRPIGDIRMKMEVIK